MHTIVHTVVHTVVHTIIHTLVCNSIIVGVYIWAAEKNGKMRQMHLPPHIRAIMHLPLHMRAIVHMGGRKKMEKCICVTGRREKKSGTQKVVPKL